MKTEIAYMDTQLLSLRINEKIINQNFDTQKKIIDILPNYFMSIQAKQNQKNVNSVTVKGTLLHHNGQPVIIYPSLEQDFFMKLENQSINSLASIGKFIYDWSSNQINFIAKIKTKLTQSKISSSLKMVQQYLINMKDKIQKALQCIGFIYKVSKNQSQMKKIEMKTQKQINKILNKPTEKNICLDFKKEKQINIEMIDERQNNDSAIQYVDYIYQIDSINEDAQIPKYQQDVVLEPMIDQNEASISQCIKSTEIESNCLSQREINNQNGQPIIKHDYQSIKQNIDTYYGGFCEVKKINCLLKRKNSEQQQNIVLAKKILHGKKKKIRSNGLSILDYQLKLISRVKNPKYLINYFLSQNKNQDALYMEYVPCTLKDYIYKKKSLSINEKLQISLQLIDLVMCLHKSGIVHRDLKPANILVSQSPNNQKTGIILKVIDFSQSTLRQQRFEEGKMFLGSTLPYSPIQCSIACIQGYNYYQIDYWSVGVIIYQLFFKRVPVTYCKNFGGDIIKGWASQFYIHLNLRKRIGYQYVFKIINLLCKSMLKVIPHPRMELQKAKQLIKIAQAYIKQLNQL